MENTHTGDDEAPPEPEQMGAAAADLDRIAPEAFEKLRQLARAIGRQMAREELASRSQKLGSKPEFPEQKFGF